MEDIEETDDLLENEYLNDGFDDVDCDLMKTKGRVHTGSEARTVDEDISKQKELEKAESMGVEMEKEDAPLLDYSDFFADDTTSNDGEAVMQLKSVPVMKQDSRDEDYNTNIFPLPFSERRATASPQVDEVSPLSLIESRYEASCISDYQT
jgi:recombination DNA repair RAD52 pathway protein